MVEYFIRLGKKHKNVNKKITFLNYVFQEKIIITGTLMKRKYVEYEDISLIVMFFQLITLNKDLRI